MDKGLGLFQKDVPKFRNPESGIQRMKMRRNGKFQPTKVKVTWGRVFIALEKL